MKKLLSTLAIALCAIMLPTSDALAGQINLSAAASMKDALNEITAAYVATHPGTIFRKNYAASGALAGQIEQGVPADVYISANVKWMKYLKIKQLVDLASVRTFAHNKLVFVGTTTKKIDKMADLPKLRTIGIGSPKSVPAGEYAMQAIVKSGLRQKLAGKLIMAKDVRESLMYAELGKLDGSFVYRTDALLARKAKILFVVPGDLYPQITYPMALTVSGAQNADAKRFLAWLQGEKASTILQQFGFSVN